MSIGVTRRSPRCRSAESAWIWLAWYSDGLSLDAYHDDMPIQGLRKSWMWHEMARRVKRVGLDQIGTISREQFASGRWKYQAAVATL